MRLLDDDDITALDVIKENNDYKTIVRLTEELRIANEKLAIMSEKLDNAQAQERSLLAKLNRLYSLDIQKRTY